MTEKCPKCGADQTGKSWFVGQLRPNGYYDAVCWDCRERNVQIHANINGNREHMHIGPNQTAEVSNLDV